MQKQDLLDEARRLANSHFEIDPLTTRIFLFPSENNERINLLEVTTDVPPSGCLFPISFEPSQDMKYPSSIILVAQDDFLKIKDGSLPLPKGWGGKDCGLEIVKEK